MFGGFGGIVACVVMCVRERKACTVVGLLESGELTFTERVCWSLCI